MDNEHVGSALATFGHISALVALGGRPQIPLPRLAAEVLAAGGDFPGLVGLASLSNETNLVDLTESLQVVLRSLGYISVDRPDSLFRAVASGVASEDIDVAYGCKVMSSAYAVAGGDLPDDLAVFAVLADELQGNPERQSLHVRARRAALEYAEFGFVLPISVGDLA